MFDGKPIRISYSDLVGCTIAYLRETKGREKGVGTRAALAKSIGITPGPYGKLEFGKTVCTVSHLFRIAEALQISPSTILLETDRHAAAIKENPKLKLEGHFDVDSPAKIDNDVFENGMRVPRGFVYWFVMIGPRSWRVLDALLKPFFVVFEQIEEDQRLREKIENIVLGNENSLRWTDYEAFVDDYFESKDVKRSFRELIDYRLKHPDGLESHEVDELLSFLTNIDWDEYRDLYLHSLAVSSLKRKKSKRFAYLTGEVITAVSNSSK